MLKLTDGLGVFFLQSACSAGGIAWCQDLMAQANEPPDSFLEAWGLLMPLTWGLSSE